MAYNGIIPMNDGLTRIGISLTSVLYIGVWRSQVARTLGVGEAVGSNPATPIFPLEESGQSRNVFSKKLHLTDLHLLKGVVFLLLKFGVNSANPGHRLNPTSNEFCCHFVHPASIINELRNESRLLSMTNHEIWEIAMRQSAIDANCRMEDFRQQENKVVLSTEHPHARKYLTLPFYCHLISYGSNIVASVHPEIREVVESYINKFPIEHCFETPNLHVLNDELQRRNQRICFMAEYFLPDVQVLKAGECDFRMRLLEPDAFAGLYTKEWSNALCEKRKHLDVLAVGAYDGDKLIGLAGCSADCESMWQIGIDVLPSYRRQGIAQALTSRLAVEILERGKVPFYCAAWSNLKSVRNALKSGFRPAWVEMTAKESEFVASLNR